MSDPDGTLEPVRFHPWRAIRNMPHIEVEWKRMDGRLGFWCEERQTLTLDPDMSQAERRCTAAHEAVHARRGDRRCDPSVDREAARDLIELEDYIQAVLFYGETDLEALAEALWVDEPTLLIRQKHFHPAERGAIRRRLAMKESTA